MDGLLPVVEVCVGGFGEVAFDSFLCLFHLFPRWCEGFYDVNDLTPELWIYLGVYYKGFLLPFDAC